MRAWQEVVARADSAAAVRRPDAAAGDTGQAGPLSLLKGTKE